MNTLEVLTLLLVVFAALSYIDNHNDNQNWSTGPIIDMHGKKEIASHRPK